MKVLRKIGVALGVVMAALLAVGAFRFVLVRPLSEQRLKELGVLDAGSSFVEVDGVRTHFVAMGTGEKAIVFVHGFSSSLYTWRECLEPLSKQYRVYALDLKGFGFSEKPDSEYTVDAYVDFLIRFMDELELPSATLCGNSMGGNIAWRAALKYPDRVERLILVDASGYPSDHSGIPFLLRLGRLPGMGEIFGAFVSRSQIRASLESAYFNDAAVTEETVDVYYYALRTEGAMRAVLARLRGSAEEAEQWYTKIPEITVPTLIIWGKEDTWVKPENADRFHEDIEGSRLVMIPNCGHLPQEETPTEFVMAVLDFMSDQRNEILIDGNFPFEIRNYPSPGLTI
ncbi:MAG: alpha/beta hydrolase [Candidatus Abyssubacteria bacterium]